MLLVDIQGDKRVLGLLDKVQKKLDNPRAALTEVGGLLVSEFQQNFPAEGRRLNEPWKALQRATIRERIRLGYGAGPILVRTGKLMRGFRKEVNRFFVRVSNPVEYFKYHQLGGGYLPQRRMILAPEKLKQEIVAVLAKHYKTIFK